ncbi:hypothetical protein T05_6600 [Trichinella murrelli]|uniref:Uncharacterized protein n=1 Tax=Trichinella murrelli TaxID=144512 RepID=A0A0V0TYW0_9BILA|nr:hypothetical protein T05_6600 [Trichinella murrelli]
MEISIVVTTYLEQKPVLTRAAAAFGRNATSGAALIDRGASHNRRTELDRIVTPSANRQLFITSFPKRRATAAFSSLVETFTKKEPCPD